MIRTITIPGETFDTVIAATELERPGTLPGERARLLATGGDPDKAIEVPADDAFTAYYDTDGTKLDWDPEEWDGDDDLKPEIVELEFLDAPVLEHIALALIGTCFEFEVIRTLKPAFRWKRQGGTTNRGMRISGSSRVTGLLHDTLRADYLIWVAADHARKRQLNAWQFESVVYHELCHIGVDKLRPHEFEGFAGELVRYGPIRSELQLAISAVERWQKPQQLTLNGVH